MSKFVPSLLLSVVLAVVIYGAMALFADGQAVWSAVTSLSWQLWLAILLLSLGNYLLRFWRWHIYIGQSLPSFKHALIYLAGFSLTTTPGKAGEAMRSLYLGQLGVAHSRSLAALLVERILDLFAILLMALYGLFVLFADNQVARLAVLISAALIVIAFMVIQLPQEKLLQWQLIKRLPKRVLGLIRSASALLEQARDLLRLRLLLLGLLIGLVSWGLEVYGLQLVMQSYQPELSQVALAVAVYGMGILLGSLSLSPGGLGASEFVMASLLVLAGFDMPAAIAITTICRIATLWFAVVVGLLCMLILWSLGLKPQWTYGEK